jgi:hypothetical protein
LTDATILTLPARPRPQASLPADHLAGVVTLQVRTSAPAGGVSSVIS